LMKEW